MRLNSNDNTDNNNKKNIEFRPPQRRRSNRHFSAKQELPYQRLIPEYYRREPAVTWYPEGNDVIDLPLQQEACLITAWWHK